MAVGIGAAFVMFLLLGLNLYERRWDDIASSLLVGISLFAGMGLLFGLAMVLLSLGKGARSRYEVYSEGIVETTMSGLSSWMRWLGVSGLFQGTGAGCTVAGASMLATSRSRRELSWDDVALVESNARENELRLKRDGRVLMQVFCSPEDFPRIEGWMRQRLERREDSRPAGEPSWPGLGARIVWTIFAVLFGIYLCPPLPIDLFCGGDLLLLSLFLLELWRGPETQWGHRFLWAALVLSLALPLTTVGVSGVQMRPEGAEWALGLEIVF